MVVGSSPTAVKVEKKFWSTGLNSACRISLYLIDMMIKEALNSLRLGKKLRFGSATEPKVPSQRSRSAAKLGLRRGPP